jgi:hypothetical protein
MTRKRLNSSENALNNESLVNLLIISLLKDGVDPKIISIATDIPEGTIRRKFPMSLLRPNAAKANEESMKRK